ncbi:Lin0512 family protein [Marinovum sp. 2_MG-2023]|uniref:Lin0512 family protein n=1 Tax=unclassified Marinovum TaxID=2647166 RepID=UPI0026E38C89|nr:MULTISPECIES: Lin0512 family protein [unclassified Marinovum]MDO6731095.1 Lin0512 family protein [Marinovum sp. 2_MG-2023]MDO6778592.1 Lin0512 family protein [Marinovum sp. 1_MG-2023]
MTDRRLIIEMGQGVDLHGGDYTKAAGRAIDDALRHSSLHIVKTLHLSQDDARIQVTIGVQAPDKVHIDVLLGKFPFGRVTITPVLGGMDVCFPDSDDIQVVASAAIEVFLPPQTEWRLRKTAP